MSILEQLCLHGVQLPRDVTMEFKYPWGFATSTRQLVNSVALVFSAAAIPGLISLVATAGVRRFAIAHAMVDIPNARSSHASPVARGGGLAIVFAFMSSVISLALLRVVDARTVGALAGAGALIAAVGYMDDRWTLSAKVRICAHMLASAIAVLLVGGVPETALQDFGINAIWVSPVLAIVGIAWATNLFNFMDGIDAIACSEAVFVAAAGAWLYSTNGGDVGMTAAMLCLASATAGFLGWNWPPARIFMGDVGSAFLGFALAIFAVASSRSGLLPIQVWVILGGAFLADATVTLLRRVARGEKWSEAHRIHAYQHLARRWKAHLPVTILTIVLDLCWFLPWAWLAARMPAHSTACMLAALGPIIGLAIVAGAGSNE
jgi:Fuc2NAc and GlcNAc transferase